MNECKDIRREPFLKDGIIVGNTAHDLVFSDTRSQREISVSGWGQGLAGLYPSQALSLILLALGTAQRAELLEVLSSSAFLETTNVPNIAESTPPPWAVPLARAVTTPSSLPSGEFCLVYTATEVLVLPRGISDLASKEALRLFTSGICPINRRRCYAYGATSGSITVIGDWCSSECLEEIRATYKGNASRPLVVSLMSDQNSSFADAPGRLHPAQLIVQRTIEISPSVTLHQCGAAMACPDLRFCDIDPNPWSWGHSVDHGLARTKAISEAVERYATGTVPYRRLVKAKANELDVPYLDPRRLVSFTASQLERHRELREFVPDEERFWVLGEDSNEKPTYVLADLVYNPFVPLDSNDQRVHCRVSSSGVAYGGDAESAKKRALLECVERDAFLRVWYARLSPPQISLESLSEFGKACIESLTRLGWQVSLLLLPGAVSVIAAVGASEEGLLIGCAAGYPPEAADKALTELSVGLTGLPPFKTIRSDQIQKAEDHTMLYRNRNIRAQAAFLSASNCNYEIATLPSDLNVTVPHDAYFVRLPTADESSDHVWRALVPSLIPMTFGYDSEPRGRQDVAEALGGAISRNHALFAQTDVLLPHPFA